MGEGPRPREGAVGGGASLRGDPPRSGGSLAMSESREGTPSTGSVSTWPGRSLARGEGPAKYGVRHGDGRE